MQIARTAIERPLYTWMLMVFCLLGGVAGYLGVGKLEDPTFTLKSALVITAYPGASASEVATEISEKLEAEIQRMDEVDTITSRNTPGLSIVEVEMSDTFDGDALPQIWDDLRDRVGDAQSALPEGAQLSVVNDDFGDVFGILYAVTAEGYTDSEIWEIATYLRREVLAVDGVANAELLGLPEEAIHIEPDSTLLANMGVEPERIRSAVQSADAVVATGTAGSGGRELRVEAPRGDDSVSEIAGLSLGTEGGVINLLDIAEIRRERVESPTHVIRHDGMPAFTLGIAGLTSRNIVTVGEAVEAKLDAVAPILPLGVELHPIYEQHRVVDEANAGFLFSLMLSVGVVIGVLAIFMGWRAAVVVGVSLLLTVTATFFFMFLWDVKVERISLGALIIAMGMLVDNAIVVAEGMQTAMKRGKKAVEAAAEVAGKVQVPLLGATAIGIMAFAGIGLSPDASGEFLFTLFAVIAISLTLSWVLAVTVTPLLASYLFRPGDADAAGAYDGPIFRAYGGFVTQALKLRWLVIAALIATTMGCFWAFGMVKQQFFPPASTPIFYLNYKAAQGAAIEETARDLALVEEWLAEREDVVSVTSSAGQGVTRFILTYNPVLSDPSVGQLVIRAASPEAIPPLREALDLFVAKTVPWAELRSEQIIYGPATGADVEARFSGPDPDVLRRLGEEARDILETATPLLHSERVDWREREVVTRPVMAEDRAQAVGITRQDVATAIALATDGVRSGSYRERDRLIPIILRTPRAEVADGELRDRLVWSPGLGDYLPLGQVVDGFDDVVARDTLIERRDRVPTLSAQAYVIAGVTAPTVFGEVRPLIEAIELPPGYALEWGGEFESAGEAQASLGRQMPLSFGVMLLITVLLFGKLRQTAVIWTIVPMAVNGVALGLLFSGQAFSFTALLGLLSLSGMLIKNAIVLVEEIDHQKASGLPQSEAIVTASTSRLRPVVLAAVTTILGMAPLLFDAFFAAMAVTIMAGLGFATLLTLLGVPVFYHTYLRRERRQEATGEAEPDVNEAAETPRSLRAAE